MLLVNMARQRPWYDSYASLRKDVELLRDRFRDRCKQLNQQPGLILHAFSREIIARAVHESNWQEGIDVDRGRTKELANIVFEDFEHLNDPQLDFARVLNHHKKQVIAMRRKRVPKNELAAYNLSAAHHALWWIAAELIDRESAALAVALRNFEQGLTEVRGSIPASAQATIQRGFETIREISEDTKPPLAPFAGSFPTRGHVFKKYLDCDFESLLYPFRVSHLHFLHRILFMGILPARKCGQFRSKSVHVSNPDVLFPPPQAVPEMMTEFCRDFPRIGREGWDYIMLAARFSFRFVRIHPYSDGNGRVSRLLMNLLLFSHDPPVYLKADKKGRHRYSQALRRADRGNLEPLASLIALSLKEIYSKIISALERTPARPTDPDKPIVPATLPAKQP
jgi:fido (protein-threonine AMPylation protein)